MTPVRIGRMSSAGDLVSFVSRYARGLRGRADPSHARPRVASCVATLSRVQFPDRAGEVVEAERHTLLEQREGYQRSVGCRRPRQSSTTAQRVRRSASSIPTIQDR